jgi:hypothetical protein
MSKPAIDRLKLGGQSLQAASVDVRKAEDIDTQIKVSCNGQDRGQAEMPSVDVTL